MQMQVICEQTCKWGRVRVREGTREREKAGERDTVCLLELPHITRRTRAPVRALVTGQARTVGDSSRSNTRRRIRKLRAAGAHVYALR